MPVGQPVCGGAQSRLALDAVARASTCWCTRKSGLCFVKKRTPSPPPPTPKQMLFFQQHRTTVDATFLNGQETIEANSIEKCIMNSSIIAKNSPSGSCRRRKTLASKRTPSRTALPTSWNGLRLRRSRLRLVQATSSVGHFCCLADDMRHQLDLFSCRLVHGYGG